MIDLEAVGSVIELPVDARVIRAGEHRCVIVSALAGIVYRIGLAQPPADADPTDIAAAHLLAIKLSDAGLNVLTPLSTIVEVTEDLVVSRWPLVETLEHTGWREREPTNLGLDLVDWATAQVAGLRTLDVRSYATSRLSLAERSNVSRVRDAADRSRQQLDRIAARWPWDELNAEQGIVHGDPNVGNLVRATGRLQFIDLDTVTTGPMGFDLAVMSYYVRRFSANYPAFTILQAFRSRHRLEGDRLAGLVAWKEISALTQLVQRSTIPGVLTELERRLNERDRRWSDVVGAVLDCAR